MRPRFAQLKAQKPCLGYDPTRNNDSISLEDDLTIIRQVLKMIQQLGHEHTTCHMAYNQELH